MKRWCFALCGLLLWPSLVGAEVASSSSPSLQAKSKDVAAFLKDIVPKALEKYQVPGAIISIVEGRKVVFAGGFGLADIAKKRPATANTPFRVGSLSKLVTATAVMQLVEQGKMSLKTDVNTYLKGVTFPRKYKQAVTLHQLLTHTSGLDVTDIGDAAHKRSDVIPLRRLVAERMTPQVVQPGLAHLYTNHGYALLGYLIEVTSGMPFAEAIQKNLLAPLGMKHSSFVQPPPAKLRKSLALGYRYGMGYEALPLDFSQVSPADTLVTTASDMALFMLAHLNGGAVGKQRILQSKTITQMHAQQFTHFPSLLGYAYGFWEERVAIHPDSSFRYKGLGHTGGQLGFTSKMTLIPELSLGIFICINRRVGKMRRSVVKQFLKKFYRVPMVKFKAKVPKGSGPVKNPERFVGSYRKYGFPTHSFEKISYLLIPRGSARVKKDAKGNLSLGKYGRIVPVKGTLFQSTQRPARIAFKLNSNQQVTHMFVEDIAYKKLSWWEDSKLHLGLIGFILLFSFFSCLFWILEWWLRRRRGGSQSSGESWAKLTIYLGASFCLYFTGTLVREVQSVAGQGWDYGVPDSLRTLLNTSYAGLGLACIMLIFALVSWRRSYWNVFWRLCYSLLTVCMLVFHLILGYWNLMGA